MPFDARKRKAQEDGGAGRRSPVTVLLAVQAQRDSTPGSNWSRVFASLRVPQADAESVAPTHARITTFLSYFGSPAPGP